MVTVFWDMKGHITVDLFEKGTTMNERYCEILNTVRHNVYSKRGGLTSKGVLFHHANARPYTAKKTLELLNILNGRWFPHPPYSPDLAPSDYHSFGPLKNNLRGTKFSDDEAVKEICRGWLKSQPKDLS